MKIRFAILNVILTLFCGLAIADVQNASYADGYFKALSQIQEIPIGAKPIPPIRSLAEKKYLLALLANNKNAGGSDDYGALIAPPLSLDSSGNMSDPYGDTVQIFKGNFSNQGMTEYAFVSNDVDTMHTNEVTVYRLVAKKLVSAGLNQAIVTSLIPGGDADMSKFYMNTAAPYAYVKDGKTYLRYMEFPNNTSGYDKTQLLLCTYLWERNKVRLVGPNWTFSHATGAMIPAKTCIH